MRRHGRRGAFGVVVIALVAALPCPPARSAPDPTTAAAREDGALLIQRYGCLGCHSWKGVAILDQGPVLDHAGDKLRAEWVDEFLRDPENSRMPVIADLTEPERKTLVAFLMGLRRGQPFPAAAHGDALRGKMLAARNQCNACHGPDRARPDLAQSRGKLRADWLLAFLLDPTDAQPEALMPRLELPKQDAADLAAFLVHDTAPPAKLEPSELGIDIFVRRRCITCHQVSRHNGKPMKTLLESKASFDKHTTGGGLIPAIELTVAQLAAVTGTLERWLAPRQSGAEELAAAKDFEGHWRLPLQLQGEAPRSWSNLERSLHPGACGVCHPRQFYDWKDTLHAGAYSIGFDADVKFQRLVSGPRFNTGVCLMCHAPLREQQLDRAQTRETAALRQTGIACAACHVRGNRRFAPQKAATDLLDANRTGAHGGAHRGELFSSSEFCSVCHQHPYKESEATKFNDKMVMDTFREWQASPAAGEGKSCQECHMPERRHLWKGIHDPEMVRSSLDLKIEGRTITITSSAGHLMPTYAIPRVTVRAWQEDREGREVPGTQKDWLIVRQLQRSMTTNFESSDTRLVPGVPRVYDYDLRNEAGVTLAVSIDVEPDARYMEQYRYRAQDANLQPELRAQYHQAANKPIAPSYTALIERAPLDE